ncbi:MAG TPA: hypothetical protein VNC50_19385, partial [Planctomycetia bacterium]|nr:hypothetical protein [Planctomycetia bacterium]
VRGEVRLAQVEGVDDEAAADAAGVGIGLRREPAAAAVGERPLGVQSGWIVAAGRWAAREFKTPIELRSDGPRTGLMALVAAALEPKLFAAVETPGAMKSLKEVIEKNRNYDEAPEWFCFGLLPACDIPQLRALAGLSSAE